VEPSQARTDKQTSMIMRKYFFTLLCVVVFASCSTYHMYSKKEAIRFAKKRDVKKNGSIIIEDNDRILKVMSRDTNYQNLDEIYEFDNEDKQLRYTMIAPCDSCFKLYLKNEIRNNGPKWKKLNDSTYISKYSLKRFLIIHRSTYSLEIVKNNLSKEEYKNLINNAVN